MHAVDVQALLKALELKDRASVLHTWRVVLYCRALAEYRRLGHAMIARLTAAAALHDVGKIDTPSAVLVAPGRLTPEQFEAMKEHTIRGHERLLRMGETDELVLHAVRHHHERWDGRGYPDALAGEAIHEEVRRLAVIDTFDALTSYRPYRRAIGRPAAELALVELQAGMGTRYWPPAVEEFTELYRTGQLQWILDYFNADVPVPMFEGLASIEAGHAVTAAGGPGPASTDRSGGGEQPGGTGTSKNFPSA